VEEGARKRVEFRVFFLSEPVEQPVRHSLSPQSYATARLFSRRVTEWGLLSTRLHPSSLSTSSSTFDLGRMELEFKEGGTPITHRGAFPLPSLYSLYSLGRRRLWKRRGK